MSNEDYEYDGNTRCLCGEISNGWHACPFKEEIHNNTEECNCCDECRYQCSMDI